MYTYAVTNTKTDKTAKHDSFIHSFIHSFIQCRLSSAQGQFLSHWFQTFAFSFNFAQSFPLSSPFCIIVSSSIALGLPGTFFPWSVPSLTVFNNESHRVSYDMPYLTFLLPWCFQQGTTFIQFVIPNICFAHLMRAVSRQSLPFVAKSTSQRPLVFWYPLFQCPGFTRSTVYYIEKTVYSVSKVI